MPVKPTEPAAARQPKRKAQAKVQAPVDFSLGPHSDVKPVSDVEKLVAELATATSTVVDWHKAIARLIFAVERLTRATELANDFTQTFRDGITPKAPTVTLRYDPVKVSKLHDSIALTRSRLLLGKKRTIKSDLKLGVESLDIIAAGLLALLKQ